MALGLLVMFRDVAPRSPLTGDLVGFYKLTEIVLKNNVQCELYSKANFQFELLARIGFCCPRLKVGYSNHARMQVLLLIYIGNISKH